MNNIAPLSARKVSPGLNVTIATCDSSPSILTETEKSIMVLGKEVDSLPGGGTSDDDNHDRLEAGVVRVCGKGGDNRRVATPLVAIRANRDAIR